MRQVKSENPELDNCLHLISSSSSSSHLRLVRIHAYKFVRMDFPEMYYCKAALRHQKLYLCLKPDC